jgi:hypothetical protein
MKFVAKHVCSWGIQISMCTLRRSIRRSIPSPTTSWYSGPFGCVRLLLVSIICPGGTPGYPPIRRQYHLNEHGVKEPSYLRDIAAVVVVRFGIGSVKVMKQLSLPLVGV